MYGQFTIIQGTNSPIRLEVDDDASDSIDISITLFDSSQNELKHWGINDVTIETNIITCPLTQDDTMGFPLNSNCYLEAKRSASDGTIIPYPRTSVTIEGRFDRYVLNEIFNE